MKYPADGIKPCDPQPDSDKTATTKGCGDSKECCCNGKLSLSTNYLYKIFYTHLKSDVR